MQAKGFEPARLAAERMNTINVEQSIPFNLDAKPGTL